MVLGNVILNLSFFKITMLNLILVYKGISIKIIKKLFLLLLVLLKITLISLITLNTLLRKNFKKIFFLLLLLRSTIFLFLQFKKFWMSATLILRLTKAIYLKLYVLMSLSQLKILIVLYLLFLLIIKLKILLILLKIED